MPAAPRTPGRAFATAVLALVPLAGSTAPPAASAAGPDAELRSRLGPGAQVSVIRDKAGWSFGTAVVPAPHTPGAYPLGWLFLAHGKDVVLEGDAGFRALATRAPLLSDAEHQAWQRPEDSESRNTQMRLPYAVGQDWDWGGGPHGWSASPGEPRSSIDLSGGDEHVLAAGAGVAYSLCTGWTRIVHADGFATDYYHLSNSVHFDGTPVGEGAYLGDTGTDTTCGGVAYGRHVHFALRVDDAYRAVDGYEIGKWVLQAGKAQYDGEARHGSVRRSDGEQLTNYGALHGNEALVDAYDNVGVNRRSGPGTGAAIVGTAADGQTVTITRTATADSLTGRWGTSDLWSELPDGTWIANAFLWTGVTGVTTEALTRASRSEPPFGRMGRSSATAGRPEGRGQ